MQKNPNPKIIQDTLGGTDFFPASRTASSWKENYSID